MAYVDLDQISEEDRDPPLTVHDGISYAHSAIEFAHFALNARDKNWGFTEIHLYALAIELAFKSVALRSGVSLKDCRGAGHDPSKMMKLIEKHGTQVPHRLTQRLSSKQWFDAFLFMSRYPAQSELNSSLDTTIFLHSDYPEMIAEILETPCRWPLSFDGGGALAEIQNPPDNWTYLRCTG